MAKNKSDVARAGGLFRLAPGIEHLATIMERTSGGDPIILHQVAILRAGEPPLAPRPVPSPPPPPEPDPEQVQFLADLFDFLTGKQAAA